MSSPSSRLSLIVVLLFLLLMVLGCAKRGAIQQAPPQPAPAPSQAPQPVPPSAPVPQPPTSAETQPCDPTKLDGESLSSRVCTACHGLDRIERRKAENLDFEEWMSVVSRMVERGARANDCEAKAIALYLACGSGLDGESLVSRICTACHSLDRIEKKRETLRSFDGWITIVNRMISKGAKANDCEATAIALYLSR